MTRSHQSPPPHKRISARRDHHQRAATWRLRNAATQLRARSSTGIHDLHCCFCGAERACRAVSVTWTLSHASLPCDDRDEADAVVCGLTTSAVECFDIKNLARDSSVCVSRHLDDREEVGVAAENALLMSICCDLCYNAMQSIDRSLDLHPVRVCLEWRCCCSLVPNDRTLS